MIKKGFKLSSMLVVTALLIGSMSTPTMAAGKPQYKATKVEHNIVSYGMHHFREGLIPVLGSEELGYWQYLNTKGELVDYGYDYVFDFSEGIAAVVKSTQVEDNRHETKLGYIDPSGKVVIPFEHDVQFGMGTVYAGRFINGQAKVYDLVGTEDVYIMTDIDAGIYSDTQYTKKIEEWYTIDRNGKKLDMPVLHEWPEEEGVILGDSYGYIEKGEKAETIVIKGKTIEDVLFVDNFALVYVEEDDGDETPYIVEKLSVTGTGEVEVEEEEIKEVEVEEIEEVEEKEYPNLSGLKFTGWHHIYDNGHGIYYKITNNTNEVDSGSYCLVTGYEAHFIDYENLHPGESIYDDIHTQIYGESIISKETDTYIVTFDNKQERDEFAASIPWKVWPEDEVPIKGRDAKVYCIDQGKDGVKWFQDVLGVK